LKCPFPILIEAPVWHLPAPPLYYLTTERTKRQCTGGVPAVPAPERWGHRLKASPAQVAGKVAGKVGSVKRAVALSGWRPLTRSEW